MIETRTRFKPSVFVVVGYYTGGTKLLGLATSSGEMVELVTGWFKNTANTNVVVITDNAELLAMRMNGEVLEVMLVDWDSKILVPQWEDKKLPAVGQVKRVKKNGTGEKEGLKAKEDAVSCHE